jgi:hypothetical protein
MEGESERRTRRTPPDHWVYLDRWWAQRLGVTRTGGVYRIRSRELVRRLSQEKLGVDAFGTVFAYGRRTEAASAHHERRPEPEHEKVTPQHRTR